MSYNEYASLYTTFEGPALTSPILGTNTLYLTPLPLIFNELLPYAFHIAKVTQQYRTLPLNHKSIFNKLPIKLFMRKVVQNILFLELNMYLENLM